METKDFIDAKFHYAVVGASAAEHKYGHKVFMDLCQGNFEATPVNPKLDELGGIPAAARLQDVEPKPDVGVVIVPPEVGITILDDAAAAGMTKLWFQPGAESEAIRKRADELELSVMADGSCIMVERRRLGYTETNHECRANAKNETAS